MSSAVDVRGPVGFVPLGHGDEVAFGVGGWTGRRVEAGLVGVAGVDRCLHFVVDFEDRVFGDVAAGLDDLAGVVFDFGAGDVFAFDDGEGFHDVLDGVPRRGEHLDEFGAVGAPLLRRAQIQVEVRGIQLAPQQKPTLLIPTKRRARVTAVQRKRFQVPCRVRQSRELCCQATLEPSFHNPIHNLHKRRPVRESAVV